VSRDSIGFGRVPASRPAQANFELENIGGAPGFATFEVAAPFQLAQPSSGIQPGERKQLSLLLPASAPGRYRTWLKVQAEEQRFELPVEAEITGKANHPSSRTPERSTEKPGRFVPIARRVAAEEVRSDEESAPSLLDPTWLADYFLPPGVTFATTAPGEVTISWPVALSSATKFQIEQRVLTAGDKGQLQVVWTQVRADIVQQSDRWTAQVSRLPVAQPLVLRVLPVLANGSTADRLFAFDVQTPAAPGVLPAITPIRGLLVAVAVFVGLIVWHRRRQRASSWGL
jgi:hypothetical protein